MHAHSLPSLRKAAHLLHLISFPAALKAKTESVSITEWTQAADVCVCVLCLLAHMKCDINNALNWIIPSLRQHKCTKYTHSTKSECKDLNWHHLLDTIRGFWRKSKKVRTTNLLRAAIWRWCGYVSILILTISVCSVWLRDNLMSKPDRWMLLSGLMDLSASHSANCSSGGQR